MTQSNTALQIGTCTEHMPKSMRSCAKGELSSACQHESVHQQLWGV